MWRPFNKSSKYIELQDVSVPIQASRSKARRRWSFLQGWRFGIACGATIAFIVLCTNISLLAWAEGRPDRMQYTMFRDQSDIRTLYQGSCSQSSTIFRWSHVGINVLSTLLLGASSACMQCLTAPTREEVDRGHAKGFWLDIGVPGIRNLRLIAPWRKVAYVCLGLSSVPLHLLYNSVIFSSLSANDYTILTLAENFVVGGSWNASSVEAWGSPTYTSGQNTTEILEYFENNLHVVSNMSNLSASDCLGAYNTAFQSSYRHVALITNVTSNNTVLGVNIEQAEESGDPLNDWIAPPYAHCGGVLDQVPNATAWNQLTSTQPSYCVRVNYCLAEPVEPACTVALSRTLLIIVIVCNVVKLLALAYTGHVSSFQPLTTIGDAIASFLTNPDPTTTGQGTLSVIDFHDGRQGFQWYDPISQADQRGRVSRGRRWRSRRYFWFRAASVKRWIVALTCCLIIWIAPLALLVSNDPDTSISTMWATGFGTVNLNYIVGNEEASLTSSVLLANTPQLLISIVYLTYNSIFTCMLLSAEYLRFSTSRKPLRVSNRQGLQRSTYWLQIPYRYAIPLMSAMALLHWLVSQSIFLVLITVSKLTGETTNIVTTGYSGIAIVFALIAGGIIILALLAFGFRTYGAGMPISSSCSVVISAACHPGEREAKDVAERPVKYGVLKTTEAEPRRVGFSAEEVDPLVDGKVYK